MSRPLSQRPDMLLREDLIRKRGDLDRLNNHSRHLEEWLDTAATRYFNDSQPDVKLMFGPLDYATMIQIATDDTRRKLESEIEEIETELEERELDAIDSLDPTGGIAA